VLYRIELAVSADIPEMKAIEKECFPLPWEDKMLSICINAAHYRTWKITSDGEIAAYISAQCPPGELLHIVNLAVSRKHRRGGIGTYLVRYIMEWGSRLGARGVILEVRESNASAIELYKSIGFTEVQRKSEYYPGGEDGLLMYHYQQPTENLSGLAFELNNRIKEMPSIGIVLGSGISWVVDEFGRGMEIPFSDLPGFSEESLRGHPDRIVISSCGEYLFLLGRRHHYQGYSGDEVSLLPGVLSDLGVKTWILTSASGAVAPHLEVGDAVIFSDHVNCCGCVPGSAFNRIGGSVYSKRLQKTALETAQAVGSRVESGVFACASGPSYETTAELRILREAGVSSVSMSTVPEALLLADRGCEVLGISLITNSTVPGAVITHDEVLDAKEIVMSKQSEFLVTLLKEISSSEL